MRNTSRRVARYGDSREPIRLNGQQAETMKDTWGEPTFGPKRKEFKLARFELQLPRSILKRERERTQRSLRAARDGSEIMGNRKTFATLIFVLLAFSAIPLHAQEATSYLITWTANPEPNISGYVIYRSTNADPNLLSAYAPIDSVNGTTLTYVDNSVVKGTRYYYRLRAKASDGGRSALSRAVSGKTISNTAGATEKNQCKVTTKTRLTLSSYDIGWSTLARSTGFLQYDRDATLDSMSSWITSRALTHTSLISNLLVPQLYTMRAVSYDSLDNMTISATDTFTTYHDAAAPVSSPNPSIFPIPYHPSAGLMNLNALPMGGSVSIVNATGTEVFNAEVGTKSEMTWNGQNSKGSPVMSGVYYAIVKDAKGQVIDKRSLMIVR
jgi:hypothetical protein